MKIIRHKKPNHSLIRKIYFAEFFSESLAIYSLIPLLFENYRAQSAERVGILLASWQILVVIFEIPTGIVAVGYFSRNTSDSRVSIFIIGLLFTIIFICLELFWRQNYGKK
jgi:hypothetical protein